MASAGQEIFSLGELPFTMLVAVMSHTTPLDLARLAAVSRSFAEATRYDLLWRRFLPTNFEEIAENAHGRALVYQSLKGLYDRLASCVLLGDGNEGYWIDPKTGGVHRSYSARTLRIVWGESKEYWHWIHEEGSRFNEVAYLNDVCWLDLSGEINTRLPPGRYTLSWVLKFGRDAHGWDSGPVKFSLSDGIQHYQTEVRWSYMIDEDEESNEDWFGWSEYEIGPFIVERGDDPNLGKVHLKFRMQEVSVLGWKSGMYVDGVVIRPAL